MTMHAKNPPPHDETLLEDGERHRFHEIEHKFIVEADFDRADFRRQLAKLAPQRKTELVVRDTY